MLLDLDTDHPKQWFRTDHGQALKEEGKKNEGYYQKCVHFLTGAIKLLLPQLLKHCDITSSREFQEGSSS